MTDEDRTQILLTIYQEVASHLRATDEKRDHLFEIYIAIVLAAFSGLAVLRVSPTALSAETIVLAMIVLLVLLALGETVFFAMSGARKWHAEYVNCSILLHAMMSRKTYDVRPDLIPVEERYPFVGTIHTSRVFILVQVAIAGTYLAAGNLLSTTQIGNVAYVVAGIIALGTLVADNISLNRLLRRAERRFWENPKTSWVFSGLTFTDGEKEN